MRKSILSFIFIIFIVILVVTIIIVVARPWFLSNNKSNIISSSPIVRGLSIALIKPTFTAAAYHASFYKFYFVHSTTPLHARKNITSDLNLLSSPVTNLLTRSSSASTIVYLTKHMRAALPRSNTHVLNDEDVDSGGIFFVNGTNKYDILIVGHQEYVTQQEYDNTDTLIYNS